LTRGDTAARIVRKVSVPNAVLACYSYELTRTIAVIAACCS
jgi:hypothetical protein